ncbi:hypothetical protein LJR164_004315 [Phenylobacterium sp. LjRoot164]|uniref:hypothetical protein n=1 Tax=unclassified Phenylobacterium TaxID=2640670 RepID=UPI003ED0BF71
MMWRGVAMDRRRLLSLAAVLAAPGLMAAAPKKDDKKKTVSGTYVEINTLTASVMRPSGRRGVMTVQTILDVPDAKLRAKAESVVPRIRAAFVQTLQIYASGMTPATPPNPDVLGPALQRDADRILGQKGAKVLLGTMLIN